MPISPDVHAAVRALTDQPLVGVLDGQLIADTEDLYRLLTEVNAQALRLLAEIDQRGLAAAAGSPTTAAWLRARLKMNHGPAKRQVSLATALTRHEPTAAALADATINVEQAQVITTALDTLPATVLPETVQAAEVTLVTQAPALTPQQLTRLAQRLHLALDPDGPQPQDTDTADPGYFLDLRTRHDGSVDGVFWLDPALGLQLAALIDAGSTPGPSQDGGRDLRTAGRRRHDALAEVIRAAVAHPDPTPGLGRPTIAVTLTLDELQAGLPGVGQDQSVIDAGIVRRLACDAGIIPIVLGSRSEVLDIGRRTRTVPAAIRRALQHRDQGCAFPGCHRPPSWADAHHIRHWAHGGQTALHNLVLLCGHHHDTIHHRGWTVHIDHELPVFTPPDWLRHPYRTAA